jgi:hypothetical protein
MRFFAPSTLRAVQFRRSRTLERRLRAASRAPAGPAVNPNIFFYFYAGYDPNGILFFDGAML